eukprot:m.58840 g.58840  ORF g.58840 m.58840 type:complete len:128 (+) comp13535_c0_seq1:152-535(+)
MVRSVDVSRALAAEAHQAAAAAMAALLHAGGHGERRQERVQGHAEVRADAGVQQLALARAFLPQALADGWEKKKKKMKIECGPMNDGEVDSSTEASSALLSRSLSVSANCGTPGSLIAAPGAPNATG